MSDQKQLVLKQCDEEFTTMDLKLRKVMDDGPEWMREAPLTMKLAHSYYARVLEYDIEPKELVPLAIHTAYASFLKAAQGADYGRARYAESVRKYDARQAELKGERAARRLKRAQEEKAAQEKAAQRKAAHAKAIEEQAAQETASRTRATARAIIAEDSNATPPATSVRHSRVHSPSNVGRVIQTPKTTGALRRVRQPTPFPGNNSPGAHPRSALPDTTGTSKPAAASNAKPTALPKRPLPSTSFAGRKRALEPTSDSEDESEEDFVKIPAPTSMKKKRTYIDVDGEDSVRTARRPPPRRRASTPEPTTTTKRRKAIPADEYDRPCEVCVKKGQTCFQAVGRRIKEEKEEKPKVTKRRKVKKVEPTDDASITKLAITANDSAVEEGEQVPGPSQRSGKLVQGAKGKGKAAGGIEAAMAAQDERLSRMEERLEALLTATVQNAMAIPLDDCLDMLAAQVSRLELLLLRLPGTILSAEHRDAEVSTSDVRHAATSVQTMDQPLPTRVNTAAMMQKLAVAAIRVQTMTLTPDDHPATTTAAIQVTPSTPITNDMAVQTLDESRPMVMPSFVVTTPTSDESQEGNIAISDITAVTSPAIEMMATDSPPVPSVPSFPNAETPPDATPHAILPESISGPPSPSAVAPLALPPTITPPALLAVTGSVERPAHEVELPSSTNPSLPCSAHLLSPPAQEFSHAHIAGGSSDPPPTQRSRSRSPLPPYEGDVDAPRMTRHGKRRAETPLPEDGPSKKNKLA